MQRFRRCSPLGFRLMVVTTAAVMSAAVVAARGAVIGVSFDQTKPSALTSYTFLGSGGGPASGPQITEDVAIDSAAGPWLKDLINGTGSGIASGQRRPITETLSNLGSLAWNGWRERIVSRTQVGPNPDDSPGFLFRDDSLTVSANYGAGMVVLTPGVDYTVAGTPPTGPVLGVSGNNNSWESIVITLAPNRVIETGDILQIDKEIFEVFGDADPWRPDEAARIGENPIGVPEPGMLAIVAFAAGAMMRGRRRLLPL